MAIAKEQIAEIQEIIHAYIADNDFLNLMQEFRNTIAYQENQSFRETIELLAQSEEKDLEEEEEDEFS